MSLLITTEGFTLPSGYYVKELTILLPNGDYKHLMFKKPDYYIPTAIDERTIRYTTEKLNGLPFSEGDVPYDLIHEILKPYENFTIYTYSNISAKFLRDYLPLTTIFNVQDRDFQMPPELPKANCFKSSHRSRYCSLAKALAVRKYMEGF